MGLGFFTFGSDGWRKIKSRRCKQEAPPIRGAIPQQPAMRRALPLPVHSICEDETGSRSAYLLFMVEAVHFLFAGFHDLHGVRMAHSQDRLLCRSAEEFGMHIESAFLVRLLQFDWNAVSVRPCILPDAGYLPRNFHIRLVSLDCEFVIGHLARNHSLGELTDHR